MQIQQGPKSSIAIISLNTFFVTMSYQTCYPNTRRLSMMIKPNISVKNLLKTDSQSNQLIDSFVERQHLNDYLPIFPGTCGPSRMDTTFNLPINDNICHSTPNFLASSPGSGIHHLSPHTPFSIQLESPVITRQSTTPSPSPCSCSINLNNFQSTDTVTTPRSRNAGALEKVIQEW